MINCNIGLTFLILNYQLKLLQVINPLDLSSCLSFWLGWSKLQRFMVSEDDCFLAKNVVSPLLKSLHNDVQFFFIRRVPSNSVTESPRMKRKWVTWLSDHCVEGIVWCIHLNLKGLMQINKSIGAVQSLLFIWSKACCCVSVHMKTIFPFPFINWFKGHAMWLKSSMNRR